MVKAILHARNMRGLLTAVAVALAPLPALAQPLVDHHQHLFSAPLAKVINAPPISAADLVRYLDDAGIGRAVVLSTAYSFSNPARKVQNDYELVRADNDWTAEQVAKYPDRLIGFCALNPVKDYALGELARCAKNPNLSRGLKLHFGNSFVEYHRPEHIERAKQVFKAANGYGMAIVVHMRANTSQKMGREEALIFLNELLPAAPDVTVQIAHMGGSGGVDPEIFGGGLDVFVDAIEKQDPRMKNVWFDVTVVAQPASAGRFPLVAQRIRQIGIERILYGSDAPTPNNLPRMAWEAFRKLPLTDEEFRAIEKNVAPYLHR